MLCTIALCTMHYALCITYMRYAFAHFFPLTCGDKPTNRLCVVTTCADKQTDRPRLSEYNKLSCSSRSLIVSLLKFSNKMSNLLEEYQSESKRYIFLTNLHLVNIEVRLVFNINVIIFRALLRYLPEYQRIYFYVRSYCSSLVIRDA